MSYLYRFSEDDLYYNRLIATPLFEISFVSGNLFTNHSRYSGAQRLAPGEANGLSGSVNLYELNVGRQITSSIVVTGENKDNLIHPFIVKDGSMDTFNSISSAEYNESEYGTVLTASYPLTSSVQRELIPAAALPSTNSGLYRYLF